MYGGQRRSCTAANLERLLALEQEEVSIHSRLASMEDPQVWLERTYRYGWRGPAGMAGGTCRYGWRKMTNQVEERLSPLDTQSDSFCIGVKNVLT